MKNIIKPEPSITVFELDHEVRWPYTFKVVLMAFCIGLITLSVGNTGCITLTAAPFMLPTILTVTEKIPRVIWLLLVVLSFIGTGLVSIG